MSGQMTIGQLIKALKKYPNNYKVFSRSSKAYLGDDVNFSRRISYINTQSDITTPTLTNVPKTKRLPTKKKTRKRTQIVRGNRYGRRDSLSGVGSV